MPKKKLRLAKSAAIGALATFMFVTSASLENTIFYVQQHMPQRVGAPFASVETVTPTWTEVTSSRTAQSNTLTTTFQESVTTQENTTTQEQKTTPRVETTRTYNPPAQTEAATTAPEPTTTVPASEPPHVTTAPETTVTASELPPAPLALEDCLPLPGKELTAEQWQVFTKFINEQEQDCSRFNQFYGRNVGTSFSSNAGIANVTDVEKQLTQAYNDYLIKLIEKSPIAKYVDMEAVRKELSDNVIVFTTRGLSGNSAGQYYRNVVAVNIDEKKPISSGQLLRIVAHEKGHDLQIVLSLWEGVTERFTRMVLGVDANGEFTVNSRKYSFNQTAGYAQQEKEAALVIDIVGEEAFWRSALLGSRAGEQQIAAIFDEKQGVITYRELKDRTAQVFRGEANGNELIDILKQAQTAAIEKAQNPVSEVGTPLPMVEETVAQTEDIAALAIPRQTIAQQRANAKSIGDIKAQPINRPCIRNYSAHRF